MHFELVFVTLFSVATGVALLARRFRIPYTVALVLAGLGLGALNAFEPPHLTKELLFTLILPGLVFEAAFHLDFAHFWKNKLTLHALAIPGVIASIGLTGAILAPVVGALGLSSGFGLIHALVFGAIIAATDPIAVVGIFKSLTTPKRLSILIEGESLLNDGTGVVLFTLVLALATGNHFTVSQGVLEFFKVAGMGALIGGALALGISHLIHRIDDAMIEVTLTMIAAYGSFVAAEHFGFSGVIATVVAGMICGNHAAQTGMSPTTRIAVEIFWEYIAFGLNSVVFLLIGLEVSPGGLLAAWKPIAAAYVAVLLARAAVVYGASGLLRFTRESFPWSWAAILTWSGLRGGLAMVLVLGLPKDFAFRELLVNMTFGVVLLSILVQGLTMQPLLRALGVAGREADYSRQHELARGRLLAANAALAKLDALKRERLLPDDLVEGLLRGYQRQSDDAAQAIAALEKQTAALREETEREVLRRLLLTERDALTQALHRGVLGNETFDTLARDVDTRLETLEHSGSPPKPAPAAGGAAPGGSEPPEKKAG